MFGFRPGPFEILVILFIVLLIFGANRLPQLASSMGKGIRLFKKSLSGEETEEEKTITEKSRRRKKVSEVKE